jgi:hypothetical protein
MRRKQTEMARTARNYTSTIGRESTKMSNNNTLKMIITGGNRNSRTKKHSCSTKTISLTLWGTSSKAYESEPICFLMN